MSTRVQKTITVNVPISTAYNQWTQFADFPQFMDGVKSVSQQTDNRLTWVAEIAGVRRQWEARVLEQVADQKIAWAATEGATNAGAVSFEAVDGDQTSVSLTLDYEPEGLVERVGDALKIVERRVEGDLERFKAFIEAEGHAWGAWRGTVKAVAAGAGAATTATTPAAASRSGSTPEYPAPDVEPLDADQPRTLTDREVRELAGASADRPGESRSNPEWR